MSKKGREQLRSKSGKENIFKKTLGTRSHRKASFLVCWPVQSPKSVSFKKALFKKILFR